MVRARNIDKKHLAKCYQAEFYFRVKSKYINIANLGQIKTIKCNTRTLYSHTLHLFESIRAPNLQRKQIFAYTML